MKWAIDKIENNLALLENINTLEKKEVSIFLLPKNIHEGSILIYQNNTYQLDPQEENNRKKLIEEKFKKLRSNT